MNVAVQVGRAVPTVARCHECKRVRRVRGGAIELHFDRGSWTLCTDPNEAVCLGSLTAPRPHNVRRYRLAGARKVNVEVFYE